MYQEERTDREHGRKRNLDGFDQLAGRQEERTENSVYRRYRRTQTRVDEVAGSEFM